MSSRDQLDAASTSVALAAVTYLLKAIMDELRHWRRPARSEASESGDGKRLTLSELKLIEYKLEQLEKERTYNGKWRHWMGNQMQRLMAKEGLDCDPMPE